MKKIILISILLMFLGAITPVFSEEVVTVVKSDNSVLYQDLIKNVSGDNSVHNHYYVADLEYSTMKTFALIGAGVMGCIIMGLILGAIF